MPDDNSELVPPDPIPNSEVKRLSADGSVGSPHVRVGHRQAFIQKRPRNTGPFLYMPDLFVYPGGLLERSERSRELHSRRVRIVFAQRNVEHSSASSSK